MNWYKLLFCISLIPLSLAGGYVQNALNLESLLFKAIADKNLAMTRALLVVGAPVNSFNKEGRTPLLEAIGHDDVSMVELLLRHQVDLSMRSFDGVTPLIAAIRGKNLFVVNSLLNAGAPVDDPYIDGTTPLMLATLTGKIRIVELLVKAGADLNCTNVAGKSALIYAAQRGYIFMVGYLLRRGAETHHISAEGLSACGTCARAYGVALRRIESEALDTSSHAELRGYAQCMALIQKHENKRRWGVGSMHTVKAEYIDHVLNQLRPNSFSENSTETLRSGRFRVSALPFSNA